MLDGIECIIIVVGAVIGEKTGDAIYAVAHLIINVLL
jgi:hypothetical protein